ncbi:MAG TPA: ATP-binding protein [Candidatus Wallbacteria bacterium]|nr:ATP-binding protein [Candidatus Wallbacteria bacterium]
MINRDQISNLRKLFIENYQAGLKKEAGIKPSEAPEQKVPGQIRGLQQKVSLARGELKAKPPLHKSTATARSIAVTSGKGGAGKTNFVANLAIALSKLGKKVLVLDADLGLANIDVIYGLRPRNNLFHVITGQKKLSEIIIEGPAGVMLAPGGSGIVELANINEGERKHFIAEMSELENKVDFILVDTSAGINKNVLCFLKACSEIIFITLPEPTAIADAYGIIKAAAAEDPGLEQKLYLIVNRVSSEIEARDVYDRLAMVSRRFLNISIENMGYIFEDRVVPMAVKAQSPYILASPGSSAAECVEAIARKMLNIDTDKTGANSAVDKIKGGVRSFFYRIGELFN